MTDHIGDMCIRGQPTSFCKCNAVQRRYLSLVHVQKVDLYLTQAYTDVESLKCCWPAQLSLGVILENVGWLAEDPPQPSELVRAWRPRADGPRVWVSTRGRQFVGYSDEIPLY